MSLVTDLFLQYAAIDTQSISGTANFPSTQTQLAFAARLAADCRALGLTEVLLFPEGYVTAVLPANTAEARPIVGFLAHMDTSPDFSGAGVKPVLHADYDGSDIHLHGARILSPKQFPALNGCIGKTLITAGGTTLLGADDKAGIAEILAAMDVLLRDETLKHGEIRIAFTPDEEIGHGVDKFDVKRFGADFAYTVDGGALGELEYESFHAARALLTVTGNSVHPGYAKGIMVNAAQIMAEIAAALPAAERPETTEGREGYFHLVKSHGNVERATADIILRDFTREGMNRRKDFILDVTQALNSTYGSQTVTLNLYDEYFNMAEVLEARPHITALAARAMRDCGIEPIIRPIRGGTDGSRLSFMGLPCPNLFTGGHNAHGPYEFIAVEDMEKAVETIVRIATAACETARI